MPYYEDFYIGMVLTSPGRTVTDGMATMLIDVGGFTAPQFNDKDIAERTPLGWRAIPGRMIFGIMGGLVERMGIFESPGPAMLVGAEKILWRMPLRVGDTVRLKWVVTEMRRTSNPQWGLVKNSESLINQNNEIICTVEIAHLLEYRQET